LIPINERLKWMGCSVLKAIFTKREIKAILSAIMAAK
jgi:hypothetical protein